MVKALLALALIALPFEDGISAFSGGRVDSPDGKWSVWAAGNDTEDMRAVARLNGPDVRERGLMSFERNVQIFWPTEGGRVVLVERTIHFASLHVFTLAAEEAGPDLTQADIEQHLAKLLPQIATIENRLLAFGRIGSETCVLIEESGLPPGRTEGSYITRRGSFWLDFRAKRAVPIQACPDARLD
ncbi:MAG: hypothetical protein ABW023_16085 [Sphingomonas sp.]